jgi:hypothetical protein
MKEASSTTNNCMNVLVIMDECVVYICAYELIYVTTRQYVKSS